MKLFVSKTSELISFSWFLNVLFSYDSISRTIPKTDDGLFLHTATQRQSGETMTSVSVGHMERAKYAAILLEGASNHVEFTVL